MQLTHCLFSALLFTTRNTLGKGSVSRSKVNSKSLKTISIVSHCSPRTHGQYIYKNLLNDSSKKILLVTGPAGTGKTKLACDYAISQLLAKNVTKIILTRPVVCVEKENLGFLPGSIGQKMDPWTRPIFDIFQEYLTLKEIQALVENGHIEISPLGFMRGRTFLNSIIIADEMQNSTPNQMLMLLTRIGKGSKMIITGDAQQSDIGEFNNGLIDFSLKLKSESCTKSIGMIEMSSEDVVREPVVKEIIGLYSTKGNVTDISVSVNRCIETTEVDSKQRSYSQTVEDCAIIPLHLYSGNKK